MEYPIKVNYEYTNNLYIAKKWLDSLPDLFAADTEIASKYTKKQKELFQFQLDNLNLPENNKRILKQNIETNGFSHPSLTVITHLSVAWSDRDSYVIVCDTSKIRILVYNFLISTNKTQIWHNSSFDFKHIYYHTGTLPKNFIDTMFISKCLLNDANSMKDKVGLKELMGYAYGDWALVKDEDSYTLENMWNSKMLKYTATDSPATYKLYEDIQESLAQWRI